MWESPAELLMGRTICTLLPQTTTSLIPQYNFLSEFTTDNKKFKDQQKNNFNDSHRVCNLPDIPDNTDVWITTDGQNTPGKTVRRAEAPRSYIVLTLTGEVRRNRSQLS